VDVGLVMGHTPRVSWRELRGVQLDPSLSLAAKGLLQQVLLRPPGTVVLRAELFATNRDQMAAIDGAIGELVRAGLIVEVPPRKRSQGRRGGGIKLPARTTQPQPEPDSGSVLGARPAPAWWDVWQVPALTDGRAIERQPIERQPIERDGRG
jgi:hypothetical protein